MRVSRRDTSTVTNRINITSRQRWRTKVDESLSSEWTFQHGHLFHRCHCKRGSLGRTVSRLGSRLIGRPSQSRISLLFAALKFLAIGPCVGEREIINCFSKDNAAGHIIYRERNDGRLVNKTLGEQKGRFKRIRCRAWNNSGALRFSLATLW